MEGEGRRIAIDMLYSRLGDYVNWVWKEKELSGTDLRVGI